MKKFLKWSGIVIAGLIGINVIAGKGESSINQITTTLPTVTADELSDDYDVNAFSADQKYKNKRFKVTGIVTVIDSGRSQESSATG